MHKFLKKFALFLLLPIMYLALMAGINIYLRNHSGPDVRPSSILIAGDSFIQKAMNPELFADAQNISQTAEPYIITCWKLQALLPIIQPDTIFLGFSHHNIAAFNDRKFSDPDIAEELFERVEAIQHFNTVDQLDIDRFLRMHVWWKQYCFYPHRKHHDYAGGYENQATSHLTDSLEAINRHFYAEGKVDGVSKLSMGYLDSIIRICRREQVTLILVSTPVHEGYWQNLPMLYMGQFDSLSNQLQIKGISVWNYSRADYPDAYYLNADHLNSRGAERFSQELSTRIRNEQLSR